MTIAPALDDEVQLATDLLTAAIAAVRDQMRGQENPHNHFPEDPRTIILVYGPVQTVFLHDKIVDFERTGPTNWYRGPSLHIPREGASDDWLAVALRVVWPRSDIQVVPGLPEATTCYHCGLVFGEHDQRCLDLLPEGPVKRRHCSSWEEGFGHGFAGYDAECNGPGFAVTNSYNLGHEMGVKAAARSALVTAAIAAYTASAR